ncbi:PEST proteolytic signal-containing nuclear protein-like [Chelonus insularis]|uniref:PEST proteolytic signal-containing nuclear protein-like n=1 Tax=Chelonus insularis TaxID=460826 RepID=UPI0015896571|nr:PEST proteolytic signal-containing nuclear protein-like [Chelonus insularis]
MSRRHPESSYRKGSNTYRREDSSDEDERLRDRSPLRSHDRHDRHDRQESSSYLPGDSKKQKLTFGFGKKPSADQKKGLQIKFGSSSKPSSAPVVPTKPTVASVFNADEDDEPEEMPAEARMRMRNIGRETPTSAGPNSFGKTKQGFCDSKKIFEKTLKKAMEEANK